MTRSKIWQAIRHPAATIDRAIAEAQTCKGCGCSPDTGFRDGCDCLRQGCVCAGAEHEDNPEWERTPGPDAVIVDASGRYNDLPPAAEPFQSTRRATASTKTTPSPEPVMSAPTRPVAEIAEDLTRAQDRLQGLRGGGDPRAQGVAEADVDRLRREQRRAEAVREAERAEAEAAKADDEWDRNPTPETAQASRAAGERADLPLRLVRGRRTQVHLARLQLLRLRRRLIEGGTR